LNFKLGQSSSHPEGVKIIAQDIGSDCQHSVSIVSLPKHPGAGYECVPYRGGLRWSVPRKVDLRKINTLKMGDRAMTISRRKYYQQFKREAVQLYESSRKGVAQIETDLGIPRPAEQVAGTGNAQNRVRYAALCRPVAGMLGTL
jgi:hypothetical protein